MKNKWLYSFWRQRLAKRLEWKLRSESGIFDRPFQPANVQAISIPIFLLTAAILCVDANASEVKQIKEFSSSGNFSYFLCSKMAEKIRSICRPRSTLSTIEAYINIDEPSAPQFSGIEEAPKNLFIFDYDETLCASRSIVDSLHGVQIDIFKYISLKTTGDNVLTIPEELRNEIKINEDAALKIITTAMKHGLVAIVSNGKKRWLVKGMRVLFPRLFRLCHYLDISKEQIFFPQGKILLISARTKEFNPENSKIPIAKALLEKLPKNLHVWSIGDSPFDISNVKDCIENQKFTGKSLPYDEIAPTPRQLAARLNEIELSLPQ